MELGRNRRQPLRILGLEAVARTGAAIEAGAGIPAWAAIPLSLGALALITAAVGVFWDVAYHIDHGRDANLFSPAHLLILAGLLGIGASAALSVVFATAAGTGHGFAIGPLRIPYAALPMLVMAGGAVLGFPLDDLWHRTYGIDVTEWSPTHLLMIGGAVFTTFALALFGAEAGAHRWTSRLLRLRRVAVFSSMILGISVLNLEFDFGVPQWQAIFQPLIIALAAGLALTAARAALGPLAAVKTALIFLAMRSLLAALVVGLGHTFPAFPLMLGSALCVEAAFLFESRISEAGSALLGGALVGTVGMASEWAWNHLFFPFPWQPSLLARMWMPLVAAILAAVVGLAFGRVIGRRAGSLPAPVVALAVIGLVILLALPVPRTSAPLTAHLTATPVGPQRTAVDRYGMPSYEQDMDIALTLDDPQAARGADWFSILAWQGGGRRVVPLREVTPGHYVAAATVPTGSAWKSFAFLARGDRLQGAAISFPADPQYGHPAVVAEPELERPFVASSRLLISEAHGGPGLVANVSYAALFAVALAWVVSLALAGRAIAGMESPAGEEWRAPRRRLLKV